MLINRLLLIVVLMLCLIVEYYFVIGQIAKKYSGPTFGGKYPIKFDDDGDNETEDGLHSKGNLSLISYHFPESSPQTLLLENDNNDDLVWTVSASFLEELLHPKVYNRLQSPGQIYGTTTNVEIAMYIESMSTFRAQTMDFEIDMYLMIEWHDHRLKHNLSHPILLNDLALSQKMWQPDLYFISSKFSYMHKVTTPNFMVLVYQDGCILKTSRIDATLACALELYDFPMDKQHCSVMIQSYAFIENVLKLTWHFGQGYPIQFNQDIKFHDMEKTNLAYDRCDSNYPLFRGSGKWSCVMATITMKRRLEFHLFQIYIPAAMLVVISWLSFWLDVRASAARISLTITTLLTLTTMSSGSRQELPHVPYMKANDIWFTGCQGFVFSVLIEYTLVNFFLVRHLPYRGEMQLEPSISESSKLGTNPLLLVSNGDVVTHDAILVREMELKAKKVDSISKYAFPGSFALFVITYWIYYSNKFVRSA